MKLPRGRLGKYHRYWKGALAGHFAFHLGVTFGAWG